MPWVRLDEQFPDHPKVVNAGPLASWLHVCGLAYCNRLLTDGFIPEGQVVKLADFSEVWGPDGAADFAISPYDLAKKLCAVGMWKKVTGGYLIHDYHDYQPSRHDEYEKRRQKAEAGAKGGKASGETRRGRSEATGQAEAKQTGSETEAQCFDSASRSVEAKPNPDPTRPVTDLEVQTLCAVPAPILAFEPFWHDYPKRNGKRLGRDKAESRWKQMSVRERSAALVAVAHYATACNTGMTIAKDPDRWLRDKCWNDWQEPAVPQAKLTPTQGALLRAQARGR